MDKSKKTRRVVQPREPREKFTQNEIYRDVQIAKKLFNTAHAIVLVLDLDGNILQFNPYTEHLSGYTLKEVHGKNWFETFLPRGDRESTRGIFEEAIRGIRTHGNVNPIVTKDGREREIEWFDAPLTDKESRLVGLLCIGQDITARRQAEEGLYKNEEKLRAVFNTTVDGIISIDECGIIDSLNPAAEQMFGYDPNELVGQNVNVLMPEPYASDHDGYLANYLKTGVNKIIGIGREVVGRRKDGSVFPIYLTVSEVDHLGLFTGMVRDITEQKQAEQERLEYQQQLRSLTTELSLAEERERRRIAADLHDQIGQALAVAKIRLGAMEQGGGTSPDFGPALNELRSTINKAIDATRSLTFELVSPVLYELGLEAAMQHLAQEIETQHGIKCTLEDGDPPELIKEDVSVTLFRAVREVMVNAVKHAQAKAIGLRITLSNRQIKILIKDDGVGFQVPEKGYKISGKGGFGLFNINERMNYLGGCLKVESRPGQGTRVTLIAPLDIEESPNRHGEGI